MHIFDIVQTMTKPTPQSLGTLKSAAVIHFRAVELAASPELEKVALYCIDLKIFYR